MMITKEEAKEQLKALIEKFESQREYYSTIDYNETQARKDFIDPFFKILGWDIDNTHQQRESYRTVKLEYKFTAGGRKKSPDYSFNTYGKSRFFVEAKKPFISIKDQPEPAKQVRDYAWNASLLISVVTDFEEFAIYDCTRKPRKSDRASTKRLKYLHYSNYLKEFDFLWDTFAYENVLNGSVERYGQKNADLKNAEPVDKAFLKSLEDWRTYLATNIAHLNPNLDEFELNFAVQQTIDRIVFLKVCEDRMLEKEGNLIAQVKKGTYYQNLYQYFVLADQKYNSGLFDLKKDKVTSNIVIDNKVIKNIIEEVYGEDEEGITYNFNIIPIEILGYAYEQFLGKVIYITPAKSVKIEEKPEVRKAGGVYYTPQYIVDYIVNETLGKLIAGKTPEEISAIKVLDPSCGSGSFLIGAYQTLLDYHLAYYKSNFTPAQKGMKDLLTPDGNLSTSEKKRILLNNIYGVDIDSQAVEVTKLSLLLKALEGETEASIHASLKIFNERVLPSIDNNIQCGNSLISTSFYNRLLDLTPKEQRTINVFDWKQGYKPIMKEGGFDIVIGNPPYVFTRDVEFGEAVKDYYKINYLNLLSKSAQTRENQTGKVNLYALFILRALQLLKSHGKIGFIIPNTILRTTVYEGIRKHLLDNVSIEKIVDLKAGVFEKVTASTVILILGNDMQKQQIEVIDNPLKKRKIMTESTKIEKSLFYKNPSYAFNIFVDTTETNLFDKMKANSIHLSELVTISNGIATFKDMEGIFDKKVNDNCKKILLGKDIGHYHHQWGGKYVEYVSKKLQRARDEKIFLAGEKLIMQRIGGILITSYDNEQYYTFNSVNNLLSKQKDYSLKYILAILNSKLLKFYYVKNFTNNSALTVNISKTFLDKLPIAIINFQNKKEKEQYETLISLVDKMMNWQKQFYEAKLNSQQEQIKRLIIFAENEINQIVYQLYDLTSEEIKLIAPENV